MEDIPHPVERWRARARAVMSILYLVAGIVHLVFPAPFLTITPGWVPHPSFVVAATGICEIAGAAGLWWPASRRMAGTGLALYAICVFPANVKHAIDSLSGHPSTLLWGYHLVRLPLQPLIVWVAMFAGGATTWPLSSRKGR